MLKTEFVKLFVVLQIFLIIFASFVSYSKSKKKPSKELSYVIYNNDQEEPTYIRNIKHPLYKEFNDRIKFVLENYIEDYDKISKLQKAYQFFYISFEEVNNLLEIVKEAELKIKVDELLISYEQKLELNKNPDPSNYSSIITKVAKTWDIPKKYLTHLVDTESSFRPYVVSEDGAIGLTQFMHDMMKYVIKKIDIDEDTAYEIATDENGKKIYYKNNPVLIKGVGSIWETDINIHIGAIILLDNYKQITTGKIYNRIKQIIYDLTPEITWKLALIVYNVGWPNFIKKVSKVNKKMHFQDFLNSFCAETKNYFCKLK
jgi:hypothetical protein